MQRDYELIRCTGCQHERVRPREGRFYVPCTVCQSTEFEVFDLIAVERDDTTGWVPTEAGLQYFEEVYDRVAA